VAEKTKGKLIETMRLLLQQRGYAATGLNDVIRLSGAPRGSLYYHFPGGKEELAIAAIRASGEVMYDALEAATSDADTPSEGLKATAGVVAGDLVGNDFAIGCPVATVALEMSAESEGLRIACLEVYDRWLGLIQSRLESGGVAPPLSKVSASFALSIIEGALLLSRLKRSTEPLDSAMEILGGFTVLLESGNLPLPR